MAMVRRAALAGGLAACAVAGWLPRIRPAAAAVALRAVMQGDLRVFDPIWTTANITAYHGTMIYDMLFGIDEQFRPQPQMVGRHSLSDDKLTYTFKLRDGLGWQDGTPVTAADCVASLRRWMVRNAGGQALQQVLKDVSAKDDRTFVIALKEPFGLLLDLLASPITPLCFMMRKQDADIDPFQQITARIGSGPFVFNEKDSRPGNRYIYDKWHGYVPRSEPASGLAGGKVVHLDQVVWENIADEQTATAALQSGEIDFYELPPIDLLPQLQSDPNLKVVVLNQSGNIGIMRMNCLHPPYDSVYARQAMLHLVNQSDFLKASFGNPKYYRTCASFFACGNPMQTDANTDWFRQGVDLAKAKALFQRAGYSGEPVLVLDATNVAFMNNSAQLIAGQLQKIGVNAQLATSDWGGVVTRRAVMKPDSEGGWDIFITWGSSYGFGNPIASNPLTANGEKGWYGWPSDNEYEKLRVQWATAPDAEARKAIAVKMATVGWDFVPQVLLGQWVSPAAMRKDVNGFIGIPNVIPFWNVTKG